MRTPVLIKKIYQLLEDASGIEMADVSPETSFLELGFDSLLLTQMAITLRNEFGTPITFRQLTADLTSPNELAAFSISNYPPISTRQHQLLCQLHHRLVSLRRLLHPLCQPLCR